MKHPIGNGPESGKRRLLLGKPQVHRVVVRHFGGYLAGSQRIDRGQEGGIVDRKVFTFEEVPERVGLVVSLLWTWEAAIAKTILLKRIMAGSVANPEAAPSSNDMAPNYRKVMRFMVRVLMNKFPSEDGCSS